MLVVVVLLILEYVVLPQLVDASKDLHLLSRLDFGWLSAGIALEAASLTCYALLTRSLLLGTKPSAPRLVRITLCTTGLAHVIPAGAAGGAGLGYRLLTASGVEGPDAGFALATEAIGSAIVLNILLWLALIVSIPLAGVHPIYVAAALLGLVAILGAAGLFLAFTRGEERAVRAVQALGRKIPRVGADHLERLLRQAADFLTHVAGDRALLRGAVGWAALNWLLDAASLWAFLAALGHDVDPAELFAAYGIANVLAVIPITPGGLGIVEAVSVALLATFRVPRSVATLGVLGWRLVNFWFPIPLGAVSYLSLTISGRRGRRGPSGAGAGG